MSLRLMVILISGFALQGCVASVAAKVVTAPVRAAGKTVDVLTTSQAEADRNRGREMRKQEERDEKARRKAQKANERYDD